MIKRQDPLATRRRYTSQDAGLYPPPKDPLKQWRQELAALLP